MHAPSFAIWGASKGIGNLRYNLQVHGNQQVIFMDQHQDIRTCVSVAWNYQASCRAVHLFCWSFPPFGQRCTDCKLKEIALRSNLTYFCLQVRSALLTVYETHFVPLGSRLRPGRNTDTNSENNARSSGKLVEKI